MILEKFDDLSIYRSTEKAIIVYILNNLNNLENLTITTMAKDTFTSNATIIRFCRKFGFNGFKDFKIQLVKEVQYQFLHLESIDPNMPFVPGDTLSAIKNKLGKLITSSIDKTCETIDLNALQQAVYHLQSANRIFIFAKGDSYIRAMTFKNRMLKINRYIILADQYHEASYSARNATQSDCVLFITYSAQQYDALEYVKVFNALKVPTIILTANDRSELAKQCKIILKVPQDESFDNKIACFTSQLSFEYILDILYSAIFNHNYQVNYNQKAIKEKYVNKIISNRE